MEENNIQHPLSSSTTTTLCGFQDGRNRTWQSDSIFCVGGLRLDLFHPTRVSSGQILPRTTRWIALRRDAKKMFRLCHAPGRSVICVLVHILLLWQSSSYFWLDALASVCSTVRPSVRPSVRPCVSFVIILSGVYMLFARYLHTHPLDIVVWLSCFRSGTAGFRSTTKMVGASNLTLRWPKKPRSFGGVRIKKRMIL